MIISKICSLAYFWSSSHRHDLNQETNAHRSYCCLDSRRVKEKEKEKKERKKGHVGKSIKNMTRNGAFIPLAFPHSCIHHLPSTSAKWNPSSPVIPAPKLSTALHGSADGVIMTGNTGISRWPKPTRPGARAKFAPCLAGQRPRHHGMCG